MLVRVVTLLAGWAGISSAALAAGPIIDMHLHAHRLADYGGGAISGVPTR